jgi:hypothetical protein
MINNNWLRPEFLSGSFVKGNIYTL